MNEKPVIEIVGYSFDVAANESRKEVRFTTKSEHNKIVGIFLSAENDADLSKCYVAIRVDNQNVVSYNEVQASLLQKTKYLSIDDVAYKTDIDVSTSTIEVLFTNKSDQVLTVNLNLLAQRKR